MATYSNAYEPLLIMVISYTVKGIFQTGTSFIMQALKQEIGSVVSVNYPFAVPEEPPLLCIYAKNARLVVTQL